MVSVVKMATVLEEYNTEEQHSSVSFILWAKELNAKDINKKIFPLYGGKCLSRKAVHNLIEKFHQGLSKFTEDSRPGAKMAETTVKRFLCCGFRRIGKAMGQIYQCS
jgi:hypothetical protein